MRIVFLEPLGFPLDILENACESLRQSGHEVTIFPDKRPELNIARAQGADILVQTDMPMDAHFLAACPQLKMLATAIVGLDHLDIDYCDTHNIAVTNAAGYSTEAVAELTVGMMLAMYRHIAENDHATRDWQGHAILPGRELKGKTVALIGMGAIGRRTAELLRTFGCHLIAWNRSSITIEGIHFVDKETLLRTADIVSIHLALSEETCDFITYKDLQLMKKSAVLINTARGSIVNNPDLARALSEGIIAGAALDVYAGEPPLFYGEPPMKSDNPLLTAPNTLLLPHIGFGTTETQQLRLQIVLDNIRNFVEKES